jgi:hypothetical protein
MTGDAGQLYTALSAPFDRTQSIRKGGEELDYLEGAQVVERLNEVLGVDSWEYRVLSHGRDEDVVWVHGQLTAHFPERTVIREQFGECSVTRGIGSGDARKGAATDSCKRAAQWIGIGLYLAHKDNGQAPAPRPQQRQGQPAGPPPTIHYGPGEPAATPRAAKLRARWSELWGEALALQLDASTLPKLPDRATEEVLEQKGRELAAKVKEAKVASPAASATGQADDSLR